MVEFADRIGKPIQLLYYPPYHSKYNPVERCWGILEQHWNGAKLSDATTMLEWAKSMSWKGVHPVVELIRTVYEKGVSLSKKAMQEVEARLKRNPSLPKWDIFIQTKEYQERVLERGLRMLFPMGIRIPNPCCPLPFTISHRFSPDLSVVRYRSLAPKPCRSPAAWRGPGGRTNGRWRG